MIHSLDLAIFRYFNSWAGISPFFDGAIRFRAVYLLWVMIGAVMLFIIVPFIPKYRRWQNQNVRMGILAFCAALIARFVITELIRLIYPRPRPFETLADVHQVIPHVQTASFPSGHAALAFAIATAVSFYYPKTSIFFFLAALSIGVGRIAAGVHWPSDIVGGALVGIATSITIHKLVFRHSLPPSPLSHGTEERRG